MGTNETEGAAAKGAWKTLGMGFDAAVERVTEALKAEGFGIITTIDVTETFKVKLGVDFMRYRILGACNPGFAHKALSEDPAVGLLLPCNVVVYEKVAGQVVVGMIDPLQTLGASASDPRLGDLAASVKAKLDAAFAKLS